MHGWRRHRAGARSSGDQLVCDKVTPPIEPTSGGIRASLAATVGSTEDTDVRSRLHESGLSKPAPVATQIFCREGEFTRNNTASRKRPLLNFTGLLVTGRSSRQNVVMGSKFRCAYSEELPKKRRERSRLLQTAEM